MQVPGPDTPHKRFRVFWEGDPGTVLGSFDTLDEANAFIRKQRSDRKQTSGKFGRSYGRKASSLPLDDRPRERLREQPDKFPDLSVARTGIAPILSDYRNLVFICTFYARD
jgi:hypothetical protein